MKKYVINKDLRPFINSANKASFTNKAVIVDRMEIKSNGFTYFTTEENSLGPSQSNPSTLRIPTPDMRKGRTSLSDPYIK